MVPGPRSHAFFQNVHQVNRRLVSRMYPRRDAQRQAPFPGQGLVSALPIPFQNLLLFLNSLIIFRECTSAGVSERKYRASANTFLSHNQLKLILDVLGTPTIDEFYAITSRRSKEYIRSLPFRATVPFSRIYPEASKNAIDFLEHTLTCTSIRFFPLLYYPTSYHFTVF